MPQEDHFVALGLNFKVSFFLVDVISQGVFEHMNSKKCKHIKTFTKSGLTLPSLFPHYGLLRVFSAIPSHPLYQ